MTDPYQTLGLKDDADDETIRQRYLELVKRFPPEQQPERFAAIRAAYEAVRDRDTRLRHRLFESGKQETMESIIEDLACRTTRRRLTLTDLLTALHKP